MEPVWGVANIDQAFPLDRDGALEARFFPVPGKVPTWLSKLETNSPEATTGLRITDTRSSRRLVYAAGMSPLAMLAEATAEEWRKVLDTNLVGASLITAEALPHLKESGGRALFVSSYAVRQSLPGLALYRTSKVALDALIEGWRMEHPGVEFARVMLGNTEGTEFADAWDPQRLAAAMKVWLERGLFPSPTMMPLAVAAEALVSVLAIRGYADDIAIMPRARDQAAEEALQEKAEARDAEERQS